ncbi:MAG: Crp/Fnr family transcriptional regulator [Verrucomicrobiota bacterium]
MKKLIELCEAGHVPVRKFRVGEKILAEGTESEVLVVLKTGSVSVSREGIEVSSISEPGSVFGEISILIGGAHMATVTATEESEFYVIENGEQWVLHCPNFLPNLAFLLASRLKALTFYVSEVERGIGERDQKIRLLHHAIGMSPSAEQQSDHPRETNVELVRK